MEIKNKVDVVIPIYNAFNVLVDCLISLKENQQKINKIILINDGSTDLRIKELLNEYSNHLNWKIYNYDTNCGFVKRANQGLRLSKENTILLNSDTIVSCHWITAFLDAINNTDNLGTATAWSNNAEICSFPKFLTNNKPIKNINTLSKLLYDKHEPKYPEIPTAVGFCMLITKIAKSRVGYFDENHFGHGYGEENDYSMRIKQSGLKNILCDNAYVTHLGNESFRDLGLKPNEETMKRLLEKHPNYIQLISQYIKKNPLIKLRKDILDLIKDNNTEIYNELLKND